MKVYKEAESNLSTLTFGWQVSLNSNGKFWPLLGTAHSLLSPCVDSTSGKQLLGKQHTYTHSFTSTSSARDFLLWLVSHRLRNFYVTKRVKACKYVFLWLYACMLASLSLCVCVYKCIQECVSGRVIYFTIITSLWIAAVSLTQKTLIFTLY